MPERRYQSFEDLPEWAQHVIDTFTPKDLQTGLDIPMPYRDSDLNIHLIPATVRGTGIPASLFSRFQSRILVPQEKTLSKLRRFYDRLNYRRLRAAGASPEEAAKVRRNKDVEEHLQRFRKAVAAIAEAKNVAPHVIAASMSHSDIQLSYDWDVYTQEMDYDVPEEYIDDPEFYNYLLGEDWEEVDDLW